MNEEDIKVELDHNKPGFVVKLSMVIEDTDSKRLVRRAKFVGDVMEQSLKLIDGELGLSSES